MHLSSQSVSIQDLRTLLSFPQYGDRNRGSVLLGPAGTPSATATCVSPWVPTGAGPTNHAAIFTMVQALTSTGQFISDTSNFHAVF